MTKPIELTETYTPRNGFSASSLLSMLMKESQNEKIDGTLNIATVFSGIGTPEYSLNRGGWKHKVIFACERDKYARETYELNYGKPNTFYDDIITLKAKKYLGLIDCLFGGSPCQSFSIAGKRGGLDDTRGTLFYEYARVLKECEAKTFVYENVKGMVNHDKPKVCQFELNILKNINHYSWQPIKLQFKLSSKKYFNLNKEALKTKKGVVWEGSYFKEGYPSLVNSEYDGKKKGIGKTLHIVENTFKELGYNFTWTILNTKEHGVPQNRERIYIVGFKNIKDFKKFEFQKPVELKTRLMDILEDEVDDKYLLSDDLVKEYKSHGTASKFKNSQADKVCDLNEKDSFHTINSGAHVKNLDTKCKNPLEFNESVVEKDNSLSFEGFGTTTDVHEATNAPVKADYSMGFVKYQASGEVLSFAQRGRYIDNSEASSMRMVGRRLNEDGKRSDYNYSIPTKQQLEFRSDTVANCITCVQKDSMVLIKKPKVLADGLITVEDNLIKVKEAVKKGFTFAKVGDSINLSVPTSKTRRGRVGNKVAQTLDTNCNQAVVTKEIKLNQTHTFDIKGADSIKRIYAANGLSPSLTTCGGEKSNQRGANCLQLTDFDVKELNCFSSALFGDGMNVPKARMEHREPKVAISKLSICDDTQGFDGKRNYMEYSPSLRANRSGLKWQDNEFIFRKLTPRECFRLQGFDDDFKFNVSDTQAYKQAGNSMSANITSFLLDDICKILKISRTQLTSKN